MMPPPKYNGWYEYSIAPATANPAFGKTVLPRALKRGWEASDLHGSNGGRRVNPQQVDF